MLNDVRFPESGFASQGTLPDYLNTPISIEQSVNVPLVSNSVSIQLLSPEFPVAFRPLEHTAFMTMPETSIDEYHGFESTEYDVRLAWQMGCMQSVTESSLVKSFPDQ